MITDLIGVGEAFLVVTILALGLAGAIAALTRRLKHAPSAGETQALQDAPERYVGRAPVVDPLEALWALPCAADALDTIREDRP